MEPVLSSHNQHEEQIPWTWEENKVFENALVELDHDSHMFEKIALRVTGKIPSQVEKHYNDLIEDVELIESDLVPLPNYEMDNNNNNNTGAEKGAKHPRKKGIPWTPEEHELFLVGLDKYGKGDWRSISRFCVVTKSPAQVASHAQKYYIRLKNSRKNHGNSTITTTTTVATSASASAPSPH